MAIPGGHANTATLIASGRGIDQRSKKKHGEVSSPTQVRYDILIFIRPLFFILALPCNEQSACHFKKISVKHTVVHFSTRFLNAPAPVLLPICTWMLLIFTGQTSSRRLLLTAGYAKPLPAFPQAFTTNAKLLRQLCLVHCFLMF